MSERRLLLNIRPERFLLRNKPYASSESLARPWQYRLWGLCLTLSILLPVAMAWFHRIPPAYSLTDLGVGNIRGGSGNLASSFNEATPGGNPAQRHSPTSNFLRFSNAAGQSAWSEYRGRPPHITIHALFASQGKTIDLGTLGGKNCLVTGLSASGCVIGAAHTSEGEQHAFLWKDGTLLDLGTLPGGTQSYANAINDREEIVGSAQIETGDFHAFCWKNGVMTDLGLLPRGSESVACALNNRGEIVGWASTEARGFHAVLWQKGQVKDLNQQIPFQKGLVLDQATSINAQGQITATGILNDRHHTFLLTPK
jgi:probable HAF family extracellular repeat protein